MGGTGRQRWITAVGTAGLVAVLALAGCSGGGSNDTATSGAAPAAGGAENAGGAADAPAPPAGAGGVDQDKQGTPADLRIDQRAIVYTGSITVRIKDGESVSGVAARATAIATGAGGFVGSDKRNSGGNAEEATLELRVPAAKFGTVVDQLAGLGTEEQRGVDTQDVTEETVDLDARIRTQQARVDSGRRLLARATSLSDLVMLESELAKREADLASLEAKKRRLADLTALSTITAVFLDPEAAPRDDDEGAGGFLSGLTAGWDALVASLRVLLTVLGAVLPWAVALGLPVLAALWLLRRNRRPVTTAAVPPPTPTTD